MIEAASRQLPEKRYFRIGEVCDLTGLKPHVLRYWETEFKQIKPAKAKSNQRLYRKKDVETIILIKHLLYDQRFTIPGARAKLEEKKGEGPGPKQIAMDFNPAEKFELLERVLTELREIRTLLDKKGERS